MIAIGVDIGGTSIKCAFVNEKGDILRRFGFPVEHTLSQEEIIAQLGETINKTLAKTRWHQEDICGVGIGCPGSVNSTTGFCDYSNNLHWENLPVCDLLKKATGFACFIANDANAAMLGEARFGVGEKYPNLVLLTLGTGVGGGLFLNGKLYEGNDSKGAELGHSLLVMDGRECTCGRKGCLEAYVSVTALLKDTKKAMAEHPDSAMWAYCEGKIDAVSGLTAFECAKQGDPAAQAVVDQYIHFLGEGCLNFINIFRPDAIVLGGGLSNQRENLTHPLDRYLQSKGYGFGGEHSPRVKIVVSILGNDAGILGAASLAFEHVRA